MDPVRQRRKQRAVSARQLLELYAEDKLDTPQMWTSAAVDLLPAWWLTGTDERRYLQLTCGALVLSPEIRFWIQGPVLQALQKVLGDVFQQIIDYADQRQLPREPLAIFLEEASFSVENSGLSEVESLLMQVGATVLRAAVHESLPCDTLTVSLGSGAGAIDKSAAMGILETGAVLVEKHINMTTADAM